MAVSISLLLSPEGIIHIVIRKTLFLPQITVLVGISLRSVIFILFRFPRISAQVTDLRALPIHVSAIFALPIAIRKGILVFIYLLSNKEGNIRLSLSFLFWV